MKQELFLIWLCANMVAISLILLGWAAQAEWFDAMDGVLDISQIFVAQFVLGIYMFFGGKPACHI